MKSSIKRAAAAMIAVITVAGYVPASVDIFQRFEKTALNVYAAETSAAKVSTYEELKNAIENEDISRIVVTADIDVPCGKVSRGDVKTLQLIIDRTLTIESAEGKKFVIRRTSDDGKDNANYRVSLFGIQGNGTGEKYDIVRTNNVEVEFKNIIIDGGAVWKDDGVTDSSPSNSGISGRAMIDVYQGATLNLGDGVELRNALTNCATDTTCSDGSESSNYGGAVRVDYTSSHGGGTVNVKAGAVIHDCYAAGWGGGLGAYNFAHLNVYGGTIYNCASSHGGAIGCTYRAGSSSYDAATVNMYGGYIHDCYAGSRGGAINFDGNIENFILGGRIENCTASVGGAIGMADGNVVLHLPDKSTGQLVIENCGPSNYDGALGYEGIGKSTGQPCTQILTPVVTVTFDALRKDDDIFATLTFAKKQTDSGVWEGSCLEEAFPSDPVLAGYTFDGWYDNKEYKGEPKTPDTIFDKDVTLYAKWKEHDHQWVYTAKGNTVTASCVTDSICNVKKDLTLTIKAPSDLTYNGEVKEAVIEKGYNTVAFPSKFKFEYYSGTKKLSGAPVNAGNYTAKLKIGDAVASVDFTVKATDLDADVSGYNGVYDGKTHGISVSAGDKNAEIYYSNEELSAGNFKTAGAKEITFTDAGEYTVYYYVDSVNYKPETSGGSASVIIKKADTVVTSPAAAEDTAFDGKAHKLLEAGSAEGGVMVYALQKNDGTSPADEDYSKEIPEGTEVGEYTLWYKVKGDKNHNDTTAESIKANIVKADPVVIAPEVKIITVNGNEQELVTAGSTNGGNMVYALSDSSEVKPDDSAYTENIPTAAEEGTYYVWYKVIGDDSYNETEPVCVEAKIYAEGEAPVPVKGDVNNDGMITVSDISKIAAHVKGKKSLTDEEFERAEVSGDGILTVTDIAKVAAHVKGKKALN